MAHEPTNWRDRKVYAAIAAGATVFGTMALIAPFVVSRSKLPYMATPSGKVRRALNYLQKNGHACHVFADLGSGDGEAVYRAAQAGYRRAVGIELNYTLAGLAKMRRLFWTKNERKRTSFYCQDMFHYDIRAADTVMVFGVKPLMQSLSAKLKRECQPGAHVMSYRFRLPLCEEKSDTNLLRAKIIYDVEEMRIYRVQKG
jgi:hypothetical protein